MKRDPEKRRSLDAKGFRPGGQWTLAGLTMLVAVVAGLFMGRPDVVVIGLPLAVVAASGWAPSTKREGGDADADVTFTVRASDEQTNDDGRRRFRVGSHGRDGIALIQPAVPGRGTASALIAVGDRCAVAVPVPLTGRARVLTVGAGTLSADGIARQNFVELDPAWLTVLPPVSRTLIRALPLPHQLRGHTGEHTSRQTGDGGELRSIDTYRPGDQLRRIDWRATARQSSAHDQLFVRRTYAHSEAGIHLLIDTAVDLPASVQAWFPVREDPLGAVTSLHLSREAATLLSASYLASGDRVGLNDLSGRHRPLRAAGGRRQLDLIRTHLALMSAAPRQDTRRQHSGAPAGSLVYVLSPFVDGELAQMMRAWRVAGHGVVGVDTFPWLADAQGSPASSSCRRAVRLTLLQRRQVLNSLAAEGLPVFGYRGEHAQPAADTHTSLDTLAGQLPLATGLSALRRSAQRGRPFARTAL